RRRAYERLRRRRTTPSAGRPMPRRANEDGSGTAAVGVSENRFSIVSISCPNPRDRASVTLRLVAAVEVMGWWVKLEFEVGRDLPFGKPVSVTANDPIPVIASDASVIGSLDGAVMVYEIEEAMETAPGPKSNFSPGSPVTSTGVTVILGATAPKL